MNMIDVVSYFLIKRFVGHKLRRLPMLVSTQAFKI